jgi:Icc-related predicted phosphoesterase
MIIDCISDLHGHYPNLKGGDLLIIAGDLTARDKHVEYIQFGQWLEQQNYKKKIFIAGNHDNFIRDNTFTGLESNIEYLCDSATEFEYEEDNIELEECRIHPTEIKTIKIWGTPWTKTFEVMNPKCKAFTCDTEEELTEKWAMIPDDTDILITHGPSWGIHDTNMDGNRCGSQSLTTWIANHVDTLKLFICGHIHEGYGIHDMRKLQDHFDDMYSPILVNCSHVNEHYEPVNKPVRVIL